jgi:hypothetical protein
MKLTVILGSLLITAASYAATPVLVDLGVADPATPRTYSVDAGKFDIKLVNAFPDKTYEIVGDGRQESSKLAAGTTAAQTPTCAATDANAKAILDKALADKKATVPADKRDEVKLTEADIKAVLDGLGCSMTLAAAKEQLAKETAKFDADKKKFDDDKKKFDEGSEKPPAEKERLDKEKTRLDQEKTRLDKVKAELDAGSIIRDKFSVTFVGYSLDASKTLQKTFKVVGEDRTWTVVFTTQGGSAAATAEAAAKAASPVAAESPNLNRLLGNTANHPKLIVGTCKYNDTNPCAAELYVNADQISTLTITNLPKGKATVRITAGEEFTCTAAGYNIATYENVPDTLIFPLVMKRPFREFFSGSTAMATARAQRFYNMVKDDKEVFCPKGEEDVRARPDTVKVPPVASLPLYMRGKSQVLEVEFDYADHVEHKTFTLPIYYQRFWLDAGGFFAFTRRSDQTLDLLTIAATTGTDATPEKRQVVAIHREISVEAASGIVINIHPGNYPYLAFQFGIAANQGKLPSYYGGIGLRAREIGKRGLATLAIGVAMQQEQRYPNLVVREKYDPTSDLLKGKAMYGLTFPYISISLGFSFGGVSEKTNVADSITQ